MARFPLQQEYHYSIALRYGGNININFIERDAAAKIITGVMFAVKDTPTVYINEEEISTVVMIPQSEIERIKTISVKQQQEWEEHAAKIGSAPEQHNYM